MDQYLFREIRNLYIIKATLFLESLIIQSDQFLKFYINEIIIINKISDDYFILLFLTGFFPLKISSIF